MDADERTYLPAEATFLTDWSVERQLDLRKHGYIEKSASRGWARFDLLAICRLALLRVFQDAGLNLPEAAKLAPEFQYVLGAIAKGGDPQMAVVFRSEGDVSDWFSSTPATLATDLRLTEQTDASGKIVFPHKAVLVVDLAEPGRELGRRLDELANRKITLQALQERHQRVKARTEANLKREKVWAG
jgi:hypothetical protein